MIFVDSTNYFTSKDVGRVYLTESYRPLSRTLRHTDFRGFPLRLGFWSRPLREQVSTSGQRTREYVLKDETLTVWRDKKEVGDCGSIGRGVGVDYE